MKVILTAINAKYIHSNLAVYSLKGYASRHEKNAEVAEYTINQNVDGILADIFRKAPDVLCFSCYIWNITYVGQLLVEIKKVLPDVHIWLGGPEVSYNPVNVMGSFPQVEGIMCGEGEVTFLELMDYYDGRKRHLKDIKGITFRLRDPAGNSTEIVVNPRREAMDLSMVPFVYKDMEKFKHKIIYYESSRGCPFSCSYCLSSIDKCLRFRNLELVKKELRAFIEAEVPQVKFVDRTFNCKHEHAIGVWSYIAAHDKGKTNFHFEVAADLLDEEELSLLEGMRPGLIQLEIGVQSTNQETIREIRRTMKFGAVSRIVKRIHANGNIHQHLDLIAGLPYEDYESFRNSFNDVYSLHPEQLQLGFLKVLKGSYMEERAGDYGLQYQERAPFEVLSTKWLPYSDIIRLKGIEEMVEVYYNSGQFMNTMGELEKGTSDVFSVYEELSIYYEENNLHMMNHSRITRYEVLYNFIRRRDGGNRNIYKNALILDLYLRENVKNRPGFAGEETVGKDTAAEFYETEAKEHRYLKGYEGFDKRQLRKMTHLEEINGKLLLFDYKNRNPLTNEAELISIEEVL